MTYVVLTDEQADNETNNLVRSLKGNIKINSPETYYKDYRFRYNSSYSMPDRRI